jgi:hypothetical protein
MSLTTYLHTILLVPTSYVTGLGKLERKVEKVQVRNLLKVSCFGTNT